MIKSVLYRFSFLSTSLSVSVSSGQSPFVVYLGLSLSGIVDETLIYQSGPPVTFILQMTTVRVT